MQTKSVVRIAAGTAIISALLTFQNCGTSLRSPQSLLAKSEGSNILHSMQFVAAMGSAVNCTLPQNTDSSQALQSCIDKTALGGTLLLAPGKYKISKQVEIKKSIYIGTSGTNANSKAACEALACAEFIADRDVYGAAGFLLINSDDVVFDHIVIDGDRSNRLASQAASTCQAGNNNYGYNISFHGNRIQITNSLFKNALCATGIYISGSSYLIQGNTIKNNGQHNASNMWSDGMTIGEMSQSKVLDNVFIDNTDVDLIFGACADCKIQNNKVIHSDSFASSSFAGIMIQAWPSGGTSGNYSNADISGNTVNCSTGQRCGFGLYIGASAWYKANIFGGVIHDNTISGAQQGLAIDQVHDMSIYNNGVTGSGGIFLTSCGQKNLSAFVVTPGTVVDQSKDQIAANNYLRFSVEGCIPNWWVQESARQIPADPQQPHNTPTNPDNSNTTVSGPTKNSVLSGPDLFLQQLYSGFLQRSVDPTGQAYWSSKASQKNSCITIAKGIAESTEYLNRKNNISPAQVAADLYNGLLGRPIESSAQTDDRVRQLQNNTFDQVINSITGSPEFRNRCRSLGLL